jgi:hypothetical protein
MFQSTFISDYSDWFMEGDISTEELMCLSDIVKGKKKEWFWFWLLQR